MINVGKGVIRLYTTPLSFFKLVAAASHKINGGNYEDADDTIEQAEETATRVYETKEIGLRITLLLDGYKKYNHIPLNKLTYEQKLILNDLMSNNN